MSTIDIVGPSDAARAALRLGFARESAAWHRQAALAALAGDTERARTLTRVAEIAGLVSRGGQPCSEG